MNSERTLIPVFLNRLSRPKPGETPESILATGKVTLLEKMLPRILKKSGPQEGTDYYYLEDIHSRLTVHQEGELLDRAFTLIRQGRANALVVTEIPRLTGNKRAAVDLEELCVTFRVPIFTNGREDLPYRCWEPEDMMQLEPLLFVSNIETTQFRARVRRSRTAAYPLDVLTGEWTMGAHRGKGRNMNGSAAFGYIWDKASKKNFLDETIPCPDFVPEGAATPPAFRCWEIAQKILVYCRHSGSKAISDRILAETGLLVQPNHINMMMRNPFYAGRPTTRYEGLAGKGRRRRERPMACEGDYPPILSYADFLENQAAIDARDLTKIKTSSHCWASELLVCACGEPYVGYGPFYGCRELLHRISNRSNRRRRERQGLSEPGRGERFIEREDWVRTETCGRINKEVAHRGIEAHLAAIFSQPDLEERLHDWREAQAAQSSSRESLRSEIAACKEEVAQVARMRENLIDLAMVQGVRKQDIETRMKRLDSQEKGLCARLTRLTEVMEAPDLPDEALLLILKLIGASFEEYWHSGFVPDREKYIIAHALLSAVKVEGTDRNKRVGEPTMKGQLDPAYGRRMRESVEDAVVRDSVRTS